MTSIRTNRLVMLLTGGVIAALAAAALAAGPSSAIPLPPPPAGTSNSAVPLPPPPSGVPLPPGPSSTTKAAKLATPTVKLSTTTEDHIKYLIATVTLKGKPIQNVRVSFFVKRMFGNLAIPITADGNALTYDDGTAATDFPHDLPGDKTGKLNFLVKTAATNKYAATTTEDVLPGGVPVKINDNPFPRALWAPRAPVLLILVVTVLMAGVWCTYGFVVIQILRIRRKGNNT